MKENMFKFFRRIGIIAACMIIVFVLFMTVFVPLIKNSMRPAYLDIEVTPASATVEINGNKYSNGVYELDPGEYSIAIKTGDEVVQESKLTLEKGKTSTLYLDITADGETDSKTAEEKASYDAISGVMPLNFSICGTPATRMNCDSITVDYKLDEKCGSNECVVITGRAEELSENVLVEVKTRLENRGFNLNDYQYIYKQNANK